MKTNSKTSLQNHLTSRSHRTDKSKVSHKQKDYISQQAQQLQLQQQNHQLSIIISNYNLQIQQLKKSNLQHQHQIQSLIQFNQRLLSIIEEQINFQDKQQLQNINKNLKEKSLKPISECTEVESQVMESLLISLKKNTSRIPKSQVGDNPKDKYVDFRNSGDNQRTNKIFDMMNQNIMKNVEKSQQQYHHNSQFEDFTSTDTNKFIKRLNIKDITNKNRKKYTYTSQVIDTDKFNYQQNEEQKDQKTIKMMNKQLQMIKDQSLKTNQFLQNKILQLKQLSNKIAYEPQKKFNQIKQKTKLSPVIAQLVKNAMLKSK